MRRKISELATDRYSFGNCFISRRAAAEESPADRVSIGAAIQLVSPPVPRQFGWLYASLAT